MLARRLARSGRVRKGGRLLVEVAVAAAVGAVALLALVGVLLPSSRLSGLSKERNAARRAAERRLAEIACLDAAAFRDALAAGPGAPLLAFDVGGLEPAPGAARTGTVTVVPAPGTPEFEAATLFEVRAECVWIGVDGAQGLVLVMLYRPERRGAGP